MKKQELERLISEFFNRKHCLLLGSGTTSLYVIFRALDLPQNSKVIYPDITCETALNAAIYAGLTPLFCDIELNTFNLAAKRAVALCGDEVGAIVPTHLFGNIMNIDGLRKELGGREIFVLEDAAQSFGGVLEGKKTGNMGDASIISFGSGKTIDCGGGGALLTDSDEFYEKCIEVSRTLNDDTSDREALRKEFLLEMFKLSKEEEHMGAFIKERDRLKKQYKDAYVFNITEELVDKIGRAFDDVNGIIEDIRKKSWALQDILSHNTKATLPAAPGNPVYWRYSFMVSGRRDVVLNRIKGCKIKASRFFSPLHLEYDLPDADYPNAMRLYEAVINIGLDFPGAEADKIAATLNDAVEEYAA